MKYFYFFIFCCTTSLVAQTYHPDKIRIDGMISDYRYHHMETYFNYYPQKRPVVNKDSTIISRGYIAEYEIVNNQMYLRDLKTPLEGNYQHLISNTKNIITENAAPLKLHWIDGLFDVGIGNPNYPDTKDTLNPVYNTYFVFETKRGVVINTNLFNYKQYKAFKDYQWERFRPTAAYKKLYDKLLLTTLDPSAIQAHIYHNILFYSKQNFLRKSS
ncbi:hypothetical protein [Flavobacterium sp. NKUCC04_CG]|uniref:hypothetical protein n=1 Tax=Flavobacterium sp. NKUCC04_CG TaxID=2842121 RepID=UPI001C5B5D1C|nr:hypothetical protein [Flavobacterium sp. NKUCC04_CG]MBW3519848.1 hypothetical protein [Flavobacterium sp. NKUCC04_CG]